MESNSGETRTFGGKELLMTVVAVVIVVACAMYLVDRRGWHRDTGNRRVRCSANLRAIGQAMAMYRLDHNDSYPVTLSCTDPKGTFVQTNDNYFDPVHPSVSGRWGTAVQQNLFLLVAEALLDDRYFICPNSGDVPTERFDADGNPLGEFGFAGPENISYGLQSPGTDPGANPPSSASSLAAALSDEVAIVADEGNVADLTAPTDHHGGQGTAVLYVGTNVEFSTASGNAAGYNDNNIYAMDMDAAGAVTAQRGWIDAVNQYDSIIVWKP